MKPVHISLIIIILLATLVTACISPSPPAPPAVSPVPELTTVKIAYLPIISYGPVYIAAEEGYFARQGIRIEFEKFQTTAMAIPSLVNGDIAVSGGQLSPGLINSISQGAHIRITADKGKMMPGTCNSTALMVRRDLVENGTVKTVSDLRGRKVAASSDQSYGIYRALAMGNLTADDVEMVDMTSTASLVAFENGAIDASLLMEPYVTQAVSRGNVVVFMPAQVFEPDFPTPLYYGPAFIDKDPDLGRRFMIAYLQGVRQYNQGKTDRNIAILANYTQLDRELLEQSCWVNIEENGLVPEQPVKEYMDWMYANKKITRTLDPDQLFDMSFVSYAHGVLQNTTGSG